MAARLRSAKSAIVIPFSRVITSSLSVVDVATGAVRVLTKGDAVQPAWSPSGTRLAYWANLNGQRDLYTIAAAGGDPVKVTDDPALDWSVVWAPDGRSLVLRERPRRHDESLADSGG